MIILAFDTCLDKMYVALADDDKILASKIIESTESHYHSAFLISTIRDILKENSVAPADVNVIATNIGPGSFTGIRACTTVTRAFAQGQGNIKTVGVSSLEILSRIALNDKKVIVALDARKEMAYIATYENGKQIIEPETILLTDLKEMLSNDCYLITDDKLKPILGGISYQDSEDDFGKYLIEIAREKISDENVDTDWRKLHPLYIQPPPVSVKKS